MLAAEGVLKPCDPSKEKQHMTIGNMTHTAIVIRVREKNWKKKASEIILSFPQWRFLIP